MNLAEEEIAKHLNGTLVPEEIKDKIPERFHYVEGKIEEGAVIEDTEGNQFVWIPVDGIKVKYERQDFGKQAGNYSDFFEELVTTLQNSVNENGGFYIARFEAGNSNKNDPITDKVVSKKNNTVYNYVTRDQAKELAEGMYPGKSKLVSSYAWDAVMNFVADETHSVTDSRSWGNHLDSITPANVEGVGKLKKRYSEYWKAKNIYDLAGNVREWSTECFSISGESCVFRGGDYFYSGESDPVSHRYLHNATYGDGCIAFRVTLYL